LFANKDQLAQQTGKAKVSSRRPYNIQLQYDGSLDDH